MKLENEKLSGDVLLEIIREGKISDKAKCDWGDDRSINANMVKEFAAVGRDWFAELEAALKANRGSLKERKEALKEKNIDVIEDVFNGGTREEKLKALAYSTKLDDSFNTKTEVKADVEVKTDMSSSAAMREILFILREAMEEDKDE